MSEAFKRDSKEDLVWPTLDAAANDSIVDETDLLIDYRIKVPDVVPRVTPRETTPVTGALSEQQAIAQINNADYYVNRSRIRHQDGKGPGTPIEDSSVVTKTDPNELSVTIEPTAEQLKVIAERKAAIEHRRQEERQRLAKPQPPTVGQKLRRVLGLD